MDFGVHLAILLLIGTGATSEKTTARTWIAKATAARRQADSFRCSNGNITKRLKSVDPDIQNGMTRPSKAASDERTNMCVSSGCFFSAGWVNSATFNSLPHIRPSTSSATKCSIIGVPPSYLDAAQKAEFPEGYHAVNQDLTADARKL